MQVGLAPVANVNTEILILGSFPSELSLKTKQYYANPKNQFWRLLALVLRQPLQEMEYVAKLDELRRFHIGLWDVYERCERKGSLDAAITYYELNKFSQLREASPDIRLVCFNGKTSATHVKELTMLGLNTITLPSSSPANTLSLEKKLEIWNIVASSLI
jgi:double-stranded uracil-DNA glycosylase